MKQASKIILKKRSGTYDKSQIKQYEVNKESA